MKKLYFLSTVYLFFSITGLSCKEDNNQVQLLVYSYNRPLQLYAFLESASHYVKNINYCTVLYRADSNFAPAYDAVKKEFPQIAFIRQSPVNPKGDFKQLTMEILNNTPASFCLFAVDDIIVKDYVDCADCVRYLQKTGAYAFFLRLGLHLNYCYTMRRAQKIPSHKRVDSKVVTWKFNRAVCDWGYPNNVDMTLYRKQDVIKSLSRIAFSAPNNMEGQWAACSVKNQWGLCYRDSKMVNIPLNVVQEGVPNYHMNLFSVEALLQKFNEGLKINIHALYNIKNRSSHIDYYPEFIIR
ncbi:MAG: hypothetical protein WC707_03640 [Candidatus Babeliaceae bacterium]|jgi:hypothetical protein